MGIINSITMLAIILAGAAVVREPEHGTMDHLLVMPLTPFEIAMSKIWATAIGIYLGTIARSMPQLGLLCMLVFLPMNMLSGSNTPLESMPSWLATLMVSFRVQRSSASMCIAAGSGKMRYGICAGTFSRI